MNINICNECVFSSTIAATNVRCSEPWKNLFHSNHMFCVQFIDIICDYVNHIFIVWRKANQVILTTTNGRSNNTSFSNQNQRRAIRTMWINEFRLRFGLFCCPIPEITSNLITIEWSILFLSLQLTCQVRTQTYIVLRIRVHLYLSRARMAESGHQTY